MKRATAVPELPERGHLFRTVIVLADELNAVTKFYVGHGYQVAARNDHYLRLTLGSARHELLVTTPEQHPNLATLLAIDRHTSLLTNVPTPAGRVTLHYDPNSLEVDEPRLLIDLRSESVAQPEFRG